MNEMNIKVTQSYVLIFKNKIIILLILISFIIIILNIHKAF